MSYLNQSNNGITYCEVIETEVNNEKINYAIYMGDDTSIITCEKTSSSPGVYSTDDLDNQISDPNIIHAVQSWYDKRINSKSNNITVRQQVRELLEMSHGANFKPIMGLPKLTKMLTSALTNIKELMTIYEDTNCFSYVCFGYRYPLAEFMDKNNYEPLYFFPDRFYTAACFETRFNSKFGLCMIPHGTTNFKGNILSIMNLGGDKISFIVSVDWKVHGKSLAETFTD